MKLMAHNLEITMLSKMEIKANPFDSIQVLET